MLSEYETPRAPSQLDSIEQLALRLDGQHLLQTTAKNTSMLSGISTGAGAGAGYHAEVTPLVDTTNVRIAVGSIPPTDRKHSHAGSAAMGGVLIPNDGGGGAGGGDQDEPRTAMPAPRQRPSRPPPIAVRPLCGIISEDVSGTTTPVECASPYRKKQRRRRRLRRIPSPSPFVIHKMSLFGGGNGAQTCDETATALGPSKRKLHMSPFAAAAAAIGGGADSTPTPGGSGGGMSSHKRVRKKSRYSRHNDGCGGDCTPV